MISQCLVLKHAHKKSEVSFSMQIIIIYISIFSIIIPIGVGLWRHSSLETELKWLLYMLILVALNQFISVFWLYVIEENNIPFFHFYIFIELLFLGRIFYLYLEKSRIKLIIPILVSSFSGLYIVLVLLSPASLMNYSDAANMRAIEGVIILFLIGLYFVNVYKKQEILHLQKTAGFWIGGGLLLYFLSNVLLFAFSELVFAQDSIVFKSLWAVHAVLLILLYLNFTIAFLCKKTVTIS